MSRLLIADKPNQVVVGWDPSLRTYLLHVYDPTNEDDDEALILALGELEGELPDLADLESALAAHPELTANVSLTPEMRQILEDEKANSAPPTPFQVWTIRMFDPRR